MMWPPSDDPLGSFTVLRSSDPADAHRLATGLMNGHRMRLGDDAAGFEADIRSAPLGELSVSYFCYSAAVEISSAPLENFTTIHIPLRGRLEFAHGDDVRRIAVPGTGAVFSESEPVRMRWSADLRLLVLRVEHAAIDRKIKALTGRRITAPLVFAPLLGGGGSGTALAATIKSMQESLDHFGPGGLPVMIAGELEQLVLSMLLLDHPHSLSEELTGHIAYGQSRSMRRAIVCVEEGYASTLTVADLAAASRMSERSLFECFRREFGQTPMEYVRRFRLERAREALLRGIPGDGTTVGEVAASHGFGHVGRFAADYRSRYGESPSETLRR